MYFCSCFTISPDLSRVSDPIPHLQNFTDHIHIGALAANGARVKKPGMKGYLSNVEQIFTIMGDNNPCLDFLGKIEFFLSRQLCAYDQADPPPDRFQPVPIALLHECWR